MNVRLIAIFLVLLVLASCGSNTKASVSDSAPKEAVSSTSAKPTVKPTIAPTPTPSPTAEPTPIAPDDIPLQETPDSSCFSSVGYDPDTETLVVIFRRNSGYSKYCYYGISEELWDEFRNAESLGSFYNANIKGQYDGDRLS